MSVFEGLTIVDLTSNEWVAICAAMHGDFGGDVVRIDDSRMERSCGSAAVSSLVHRNKRSVVVDFESPKSRSRLTRILDTADVLITDWPIDMLSRCGLDYETLNRRNPGLIFARTTSLGLLGPGKDAPLFDELAEAKVGMMLVRPLPGQPPVYSGFSQMYAAVLLNLGISLALSHRDETGEGQQVDTSFLAGAMFGATLNLQAYLSMRKEGLCEPQPRDNWGNPMSGIGYSTSDGEWVFPTMPITDKFWPKLAPLVGIPVDDEHFDTHEKRCGENRIALMRQLEKRIGEKPASHWKEVMKEAGLLYNFIGSYADAMGDQLLWDNRYLISAPDESGNDQATLGFPLTMSKTPASLTCKPPDRDEHTHEFSSEPLSDDDLSKRSAAALKTPDSARGALEGVRVIDLSVWLQGPTAAQLLADAGAEVLHIENSLTGGDYARGVKSMGVFPMGDWNYYFGVVNRGKKSVALDLTQPEAQEVIYRLVRKADVFLTNQLPRVLAKLNLSYEKLREINPKLVFATNTGYGLVGGVETPAYDMTLQALTGIMKHLGEPGQPPIYLGLGSGDTYGGLMCAWGIVAALRHARQTGEGQHVDASLYGSQVFLAAPSLQPYLATGNTEFSTQQSRTRARNAMWNTYRTKDDRWVQLCVEDTEQNWSLFCESLGGSVLTKDERFADIELRAENSAALIEKLDNCIADRTASEWLTVWQELGFPAVLIQTFADCANDEDAWANDYLLDVEWASKGPDGKGMLRGLSVRLSKSPCRVTGPAPDLGDDTMSILMELLGYEGEEIADLAVKQAIQ